MDGLNDAFSGKHSGWHTEDLVAKFDISREAQDAFAAQSQQRFALAYCIPLPTLKNWEQDRRFPDAPAAAYLLAIERMPKEVLEAVAG